MTTINQQDPSAALPEHTPRAAGSMRFFDAEAFTTRATNVLLWQTKELPAWAWICDHLRETLFWNHYFEVLDIMPSLEGNYLSKTDLARFSRRPN